MSDSPLPDTYEQAVLQGFAALRPTLAGDLARLAVISADRLAAAGRGEGDLTDDEVARIEEVADASAMELAAAVMPSGDGQLGALFDRVVAADAQWFHSDKDERAEAAVVHVPAAEVRSAG